MNRRSCRGSVGTVLMLLGVGIAGCDNSTEPVPPEVVGNYNLVEANDQPLPYVLLESSTQRISLVAGLLQLRDDRDFSWAIRSEIVQLPSGDQDIAINENEGSYTVSGNTIELRTTTGGRIRGTLAGQSLSFTITGSEGSITLDWLKE